MISGLDVWVAGVRGGGLEGEGEGGMWERRGRVERE